MKLRGGTMSRIELWTDASGKNNKFGWAYAIHRNDILIDKKYGLCECKNIFEAEIIAVINGIKGMPSSIMEDVISICSDCRVLTDSMRQGKYHNSFMVELNELTKDLKVRWIHIPGHSGFSKNQRVDSLARKLVVV